MSNGSTGGPAFPQQVIRDGNGVLQEVGVYGFSTGMTLRDYFAAKAMQGFITLMIRDFDDGETVETYEQAQERICSASYEYADAMIRERAK
jgi:hypothetical protein